MNPVPRRIAAALLAAGVLLAGCSEPSNGAAPSTISSTPIAAAASVFDPSAVHSIAVEVKPTDYDAMVAAYQQGGDKEWVHATVTIDGEAFRDVGLRLKGNLSLRTTDLSADPSGVPFLLKLDEFVDGQDKDGWTQFAVRSATNETALNEAVALDLLRAAGLASQQAVAVRFSVNGGAQNLRLVVQNPDSTWDAATFDTEGLLYKAEAGGDYSYRGTDPAAYTDVFDQETHKKDPDLTPLVEFLDFLNNSTDAKFAATLADHLDVVSFARYLALEELMANSDDIEGGGNNSYLRWDSSTDAFTVVAWDHNSAFGGGIGPDGGRGGMGGGMRPGGDGGDGGVVMRGPGGGRGQSNILVQRFNAVPEFATLVTAAKADLTQLLYTGGAAEQSLDRWVAVLEAQAADLVPVPTIRSEAAAVQRYFSG